MSDSYEWTVTWPYQGANHVVVTGTFDNWSLSRILRKNPTGTFETVIKVPYGQKVLYKFMVDGTWVAVDTRPTEFDNIGNLNNVFFAPEKPAKVPESKPEPISATDVASTVIASEGASNPLAYVASGIGAAIKAVVGVDPVNADKIPVETPKTEAAPPPPPPAVPVPQPAKAPIVPIEIIPLNVAPETTAPEPKTNGHINEASTHAPAAPATFIIEEPKAEAPIPGPAPEPTPAAPVPEPEPTPVVSEPVQVKEEPTPQIVAEHALTTPNGVEAPKTNGVPPRPVTPPPPAPVQSASAPTTPAKKHLFSKSSTESPSKHSRKGSTDAPNSPGKSSFDSSSKRSASLNASSGSTKKKKKRHSLITKIKEIFHHHHDKEESK